ncbi:hypothetical protein ONZ43_g1540 [Nemania bipapillata]|uniref:Uncharacterized protein n=1 Tax=Nemania bipapillata TaxID=110536 RepID=A0ACC2J4T3_9PEZI|nr:hypothetical protein ONZ43_g1540 [Nemania bipapillata]
MNPSTPSSSTSSTNGSAPASAFAPVSTTTAASTGSSLILRQRASAGAATTTASTSTSSPGTTTGPVHSPQAAPEPGTGPPLNNDAGQYKRGPSPSLDSQSPDSSGSQPGSRDNVPAIPHDHRIKKRRTGPGSRGVANLTPEQLAKKRANDREAQRAIRERTKNQIEALENRIRELTEQQPYQELQKVIRQKEAAEAKNVELTAHLRSIMVSIQTLLSGNMAEGALASLVPTYNSIQSAQQQQQQLSSYSAPSGSTPGNEPTSHFDVDSYWRSPALFQSASAPSSDNDGVSISLRQNSEYSQLGFLSDPLQRSDRMQTDTNGAQDSLPAYQHMPVKYELAVPTPAKHDNNTASGGASPLLLLPPTQQQFQHMGYTASLTNSPQISYVGMDGPIKHVAATCPIDTLLLNVMQERRQRVAKGVPTQDVVGPKQPSVYLLFNPNDDIPSNSKIFLSKVFAEIMSKFSALDRLPERVAILYVVYRIDIQFEKAHPPWIDYVPFPKMREEFVRNYDAPGFNFETMFLPYTQTLSLNWPYEDKDVLYQAADGSEITINPIFEQHLLDINNWSLGDAFDRACPALRGTYNLKSEGKTSIENRRTCGS